MKIEIKEQKKNPLLKREEVSVSIEHPGKATPSRREILPELAKVLKSNEDLIIIDKIFSVHGMNVSEARLLVYKKKDEIPRYVSRVWMWWWWMTAQATGAARSWRR